METDNKPLSNEVVNDTSVSINSDYSDKVGIPVNYAQKIKKHQKKWKIITCVFALLTLVPFGIVVFLYKIAMQMRDEGTSGSEFIALLAIPFYLAFIVFLVTDSVLAIHYLRSQKPGGKYKIFPVVVVTIGCIFLFLLIYSWLMDGYSF